jgi:hypothetical protein
MKIRQNVYVQITEQGNVDFVSSTPVELTATGGKLTAQLLDAVYDLHSVSADLVDALTTRLSTGELAGSLFHGEARRLFFFTVTFATA